MCSRFLVTSAGEMTLFALINALEALFKFTFKLYYPNFTAINEWVALESQIEPRNLAKGVHHVLVILP